MATNYKFLLADLPPEKKKKKTFNSFRDRLKCKSVATLWCVSGKLWWIFGSWGDYTCQGGNQVVSKHFWKTCTLASKDRIRIDGLGFQSSIVRNLPSMVKHWLIYSHHSRFWPLLGSRSHFCNVSTWGMKNHITTQTNPMKIKIPVSPSFVQMWLIFPCQSLGHGNKPGLHRTLDTLGSVVWFKFAACLASSSSKVVLLSWCQPVYHSDLHVVPSVIIIIIFEYMIIHVVCKWDKPQWPATRCYK